MDEIAIEVSWPEQALQQLSEATKSRERARALLTEMQQKLDRDGCPAALASQIAEAMDQLAACVELAEVQIREAAQRIAEFQK